MPLAGCSTARLPTSPAFPYFIPDPCREIAFHTCKRKFKPPPDNKYAPYDGSLATQHGRYWYWTYCVIGGALCRAVRMNGREMIAGRPSSAGGVRPEYDLRLPSRGSLFSPLSSLYPPPSSTSTSSPPSSLLRLSSPLLSFPSPPSSGNDLATPFPLRYLHTLRGLTLPHPLTFCPIYFT